VVDRDHMWNLRLTNKEINTYIHKALQFVRSSYDLMLTKLVRFGHLGLGPPNLRTLWQDRVTSNSYIRKKHVLRSKFSHSSHFFFLRKAK
jgi:hypothetical protein